MCTGSHPFIPAENTARVEMIYSASGTRIENVFHFQSDVPWTAASLEELTHQVFTGWLGDMQAVQSQGATLEMIRAVDIDVEDGNVFEYTGFTPNQGSIANPIMPGNVTLSIKFGSTRTGRSYRGRMYFIGLVENATTGNVVETSYRDDIVANTQSLFTEVQDGMPGVQHVIVSYCNNGAWRTTAAVTPVATYSADVNVDSQRRRLNGRGT